MKDVFVIGGPNGAGKTTAANRLLPIAEKNLDTSIVIHDASRWGLIESATREELHR
jgi:G3E family GTPase